MSLNVHMTYVYIYYINRAHAVKMCGHVQLRRESRHRALLVHEYSLCVLRHIEMCGSFTLGFKCCSSTTTRSWWDQLSIVTELIMHWSDSIVSIIMSI